MKHVRNTTLVSMLLLAASAVACTNETDATTAQPTKPTETTEKLEIALVGSFTGPDEGVAADVRRGVETAVQQVNAFGGVLGKQIVLRLIDDESSPVKTASLVKELADKDGVVFGIGPSTTRAANELLPMVKDDRILYISPSATGMGLDCTDSAASPEERTKLCDAAKASFDPSAPLKPVLFRTATSDAYLATALAQYASESVEGTRRCRSIALVRQNDAYGLPLAAKVEERYKQLSLEVRRIVDLDPTATDEYDLGLAAETVAGTPAPDCQVVIAQTDLAAKYMAAFKTWRAERPTAFPNTFQTIGADGFRDEAMVSTSVAAGVVGEGSLAIAPDTTPSTPEYSTFRALYQASFPNVTPGRYAAPAYDALLLLAGAMNKAGTTTAIAPVREALVEITTGRRHASAAKVGEFLIAARNGEDIDYEGASGPIDFDARTGGVRNDFGVWRIKQAEFVREATFDASVITGE